MPQFPFGNQTAAVTAAVQLRQSQVREAASDLAGRTRDATGGIASKAVELAGWGRGVIELLPRAAFAEIRRRINLLELATREDVEAQSKLGRSRVSFVLKEFLETQRSHDEELLQAVRTELREELQSFAAAIDDDLLTVDDPLPSKEHGAARRLRADFDYLDDDDDDDELLDLADDEMTDSLLDATDG